MPRSTRSSSAASAAAAPTPANSGQSTRSKKTQAASTTAGEPDASLPKKRGRGRSPKVPVASEPPAESLEPKSAAPAVSKAPKANKTAKQAAPKAKKTLKAAASLPPQPAPPQMSPKVTAKLQKERQLELTDNIWTVIEANDVREMTERSSRAIHHLADIPEAVESAGEEVFDLTNISGGSSEDEEDSAPKAPVAPLPAKLPANRDDAASEIAALKAKIQELEALSRTKGKKPASVQKEMRKPPPSFASGLHPLYFQQTNKNVVDTRRSISPFEMGGLDDNDTTDTCPTPSVATGPNAPAKSQLANLAKQGLMAKDIARDAARKNDNVVVALWDQPPQSQARTTAVPPRVKHGQALRRHETFIELAPTNIPAPSHTPVNIHAPTSTRAPASMHAHAGTRVPASAHASTSANANAPTSTKPTLRKSKKASKQGSENGEGGRLTANDVRTTDLPPFLEARNKWKAVFLPSLYHTFFLSMEIFDAFRSSSPEFLETVQELIDLIYPESRYVLAEAGDPIVLTAYNRISIIRSQVASYAVTIIQEHMRETFRLQDRHAAPDYHNAHSWLLWARQLAFSPLFFEVPTPLECRVPQDDPAFIVSNPQLFAVVVAQTQVNSFHKAECGLLFC
ncbi:hypothetical protein EST38_g9617 [Candolleomyces aberdarensis]|uniref:Uncharacterized protein n=1 Tax=Candolleomyces aberdarensis TaxID=2316362 RepID=A0A4Q2D9I8_9AGAR|nr:hypothetical protein EST38_g9617 [Candolleomyces aberdarensis]